MTAARISDPREKPPARCPDGALRRVRVGLWLLGCGALVLWPTIFYLGKHAIPWSKTTAVCAVLYLALEGAVLSLLYRGFRGERRPE
jgi:hypothetical protein